MLFIMMMEQSGFEIWSRVMQLRLLTRNVFRAIM